MSVGAAISPKSCRLTKWQPRFTSASRRLSIRHHGRGGLGRCSEAAEATHFPALNDCWTLERIAGCCQLRLQGQVAYLPRSMISHANRG